MGHGRPTTPEGLPPNDPCCQRLPRSWPQERHWKIGNGLPTRWTPGAMLRPVAARSEKNMNYFTSSYPHHDIYTFCYWQIFWHSIWHIFWHFIWHIFWHSIWHIFWHSIWHIFWHSTCHIFCNMFWHIFWHSIWHIFWHIFWHSIWHSIWQIFWHMFWQTFWHFIWHTFWHSIWRSIWHIFWHSIWHIFWHFIWHIFWHSLWPLRSSGAHWARKVPGWGPAVLTELGRSQVEVQRCSLNSAGPRLRSSGAHCAKTLAVEVQQCPLRAEVGEELGEELARRKWTWKWQKWTWKWMQRWWRRRRRRGRTRRRRRRRRRTTLIKSNNPHLFMSKMDQTHRCSAVWVCVMIDWVNKGPKGLFFLMTISKINRCEWREPLIFLQSD